MSGDEVLIDSVILIDHFNGIEAASQYLARARASAHVSAITRAEVLTGFEDRDQRATARKLLNRLGFIELDVGIADRAADLRRTHGWKLPDAFQAAVAQEHSLRLATRNTRDFPPDRFEWVVVPYDLP